VVKRPIPFPNRPGIVRKSEGQLEGNVSHGSATPLSKSKAAYGVAALVDEVVLVGAVVLAVDVVVAVVVVVRPVVVGVVEVADVVGAVTTDVALEVATAEPFLFVAVTVTRIVYPTSPRLRANVASVPAPIALQLPPDALQCSH
jgi:hypothetical protein